MNLPDNMEALLFMLRALDGGSGDITSFDDTLLALTSMDVLTSWYVASMMDGGLAGLSIESADELLVVDLIVETPCVFSFSLACECF